MNSFCKRKYKYNNSFCKKKDEKNADNAQKMMFLGKFGIKNVSDREFFAIFVR